MIRLLQLIIFGHVHKWKVMEEKSIHNLSIPKGYTAGTLYVCQCETCGAIKPFRISP
jgi:hypothetical protein